MKKQKMTADNVEQLMEIVRALQTGQDPAEALEKKKAESAPVADSPKSNSGKNVSAAKKRSWLPKMKSEMQKDEEFEEKNAAEEEAFEDSDKETASLLKEKLRKKSAAKRSGVPDHKTSAHSTQEHEISDAEEFLDDEFEENLQEDDRRKLEKPDVNAILDRVSESLWKLVQTIDLVIEPLTSWQPLKKAETKKSEKKVPEKKVLNEAVLDEGVPCEETLDKDTPDKKTSDKEILNKEILDENALNKDAPDKEVSDKEILHKDTLGEEVQKQEIQDTKVSQSGRTSDTEASEDHSFDTETPEQPEKTEEQKILDRILDSVDGRKKADAEELEESSEHSAETENPEKENTEKSESEKTNSKKAKSEKTGSDETKSGGLMAKLGEKGIHRREIIMLLLVLVLAVVIVILITNGVRNSMEEKRKSQNVTADKGLTVTVEEEPEEWSSSAQIRLRFRTPRVPVTSVTINGMVLQPDADGYVTFTTGDYLLEAEAQTENGTLKARIEIPKLDSQAPVVNASKAQSQITLTGADSRSSIKSVWYAVVRDTDPIKLPIYQEYTGTIPFEENVVYYFYAVDAAGNRSTPLVTNMETADSLVLAQEELSMYPDETIYLDYQANPSGALLNNLRFESMNPDIITVDGSGGVTALKEGTAAVKISADGVESVNCIITVSRTRTVTISAIGDCTLGSDVSFNTTINLDAYAAMNGYSYFFENVSEILENDDVTFANLEGTLTTETSRASKTYAFKGDPEYTEILKEGSVEVVTLANNHSNDYGDASYEDTVKYLREAGIAYCDGDEIAIQEAGGVKIAFIGIYVLRDGIAKEEQVKTTIAAAREAGAQLVVMAFHWGSEKATEPDSTQISLAHTAIDNGADLVVGHHPHVLQGIEKYNGKYIVYSLANFCFGGNTAPSDKDTMIFRQTFTITDGTVQDDDQIEIIPCSVSSVADYNNYQPTPATGTEAERIMARINEYSQAFGQTYVASTGLD